jgi:MFS family permease
MTFVRTEASAESVSPGPPPTEPAERWRILGLLAVGVLLAMSPWLGSGAVAPLLADAWGLGGFDLPLLTIAVQLGFVVGALLLAVTGAPDVIPGHRLFLVGAVVAAVANLGFAHLATDLPSALPFRFLTGFALAGVYPVSMRLVTGWFRLERGLAIGTLIGALTLGSALPYLFRAVGALSGMDWQAVITAASLAAILGGLLVSVTVSAGPFDVRAPRFSLDVARRAFGERSVRLANLGYLGHMWELYAMWTWIPAFFAASFASAGVIDPAAASLAAFIVVAVGGVGCVVAGRIADRLGRTALTMGAMAMSGGSALLIGFLFGAPPAVTLILGIVWGATVVADSAQFSVAVTELSPPGTAGSALALQTAAGFLLTGVTILLMGILTAAGGPGWQVAFALLAVGPIVGIVAMGRLRRLPEARRMAGGNR